MDESKSKLIEAMRDNWRREVLGARAYRALAAREKDKKRRGILIRLAEGEEAHAERWEKRLLELGGDLPVDPDTLNERLRRWLLVQLGTETALKRIESKEDHDASVYEEQLSLEEHEEGRRAIVEVQKEEQVHGRVLQSMSEPAPVTGRNWFASGMEMTIVGVVEAAITYFLGVLLSPGHPTL